MSANNPSFTASNVVTDIEARLRTPGISTSTYLPWVSTAFNRVWQKLEAIGQEAKEEYFGAYISLSLTTTSPNEYSMNTEIPRFGGFMGVQVKYGATGDLRNPATRLRSVTQWSNWDNISTTYRTKDKPLYYKFGDVLGFIPVPPETGGTAKIWYVKRAFQVTDGADVLDIPYRFLYPIFTYVQARAVERAYEDYPTAKALDRQFEQELEAVAQAAASEFDENQGGSVEVDSNDSMYDDPFNN